MALTDKLTALANNIRAATGTTEPLTIDQMIEQSSGLEVPAQSYILVDEAGNEVPAVLVDEEVDLTATANDIRLGSVAVTDSGVTTGEKDIPAYHTTEGKQLVPNGSQFSIRMNVDKCQYTKLQALICTFNSSIAKSVATELVSIDGKVYAVSSTEELSSVTVDTENKKIVLGLTNDFGAPCVIRFFTYKEEV